MADRASEHQLSAKEFRFVTTLVYNKTGIVLGEQKREMVYRRLMRRIRELGIDSFSTYCRLLDDDSGNELPNFINSITTNLTSFYRESHHFDYILNTFIPNWTESAADPRTVKVWSAACSTGEEPYSLSITLNKALQKYQLNWDYKILATDLDTNVLNTAKNAVYDEKRIADIPVEYRKLGFLKGKGALAGKVRVRPEMVDPITFRQLNLLEKWPLKGPFDIIMCRNVLIYFDREMQQKLVNRFIELLRPGGLLMLGHSESMAKGNTPLITKGRTIFEKPLSF